MERGQFFQLSRCQQQTAPEKFQNVPSFLTQIQGFVTLLVAGPAKSLVCQLCHEQLNFVELSTYHSEKKSNCVTLPRM